MDVWSLNVTLWLEESIGPNGNEILFARFGKRKTYSVCMDTLYELLPFLRERAFALTKSVTPLRF